MVSLRRGLSTTAGLWWTATQLADVLVMGNGIDANYKYDGTRLLPLGAKYIADMESAEGTWVGGTANTDGTYIKQGVQSRSLTVGAYGTATMTLTPTTAWDLTTGIPSAANGGVDYQHVGLYRLLGVHRRHRGAGADIELHPVRKHG